MDRCLLLPPQARLDLAPSAKRDMSHRGVTDPVARGNPPALASCRPRHTWAIYEVTSINAHHMVPVLPSRNQQPHRGRVFQGGHDWVIEAARFGRTEDDSVAMSRIQQVISRLVPTSWAASMEAESRTWMVRCGSCGFERSLWELGGIRWKRKGSGKTWTWGRCPNCGKLGVHSIARRDPTASPPENSLV
jgi:hypothetical protein